MLSLADDTDVYNLLIFPGQCAIPAFMVGA